LTELFAKDACATLKERRSGSQKGIEQMNQKELEKLGGQKDTTLKARTGRTWEEWVMVLDEMGADQMEHPEIAKWVDGEIDDGWWAQTVTVGYERIKGLRDTGQSRKGTYEASKGKTINASAKMVFEALTHLSADSAWLNGLQLSGSTEPKSVRFRAMDGSRASIWIAPNGDSKSALSVSHTKLESKEDVDRVKVEWGERLDRLELAARNLR